ncbi:MAG: hypothetical protein JO287_27225 [Pseudonocardiales bacterium]|nr:hypothetical protein [Pseudonocardiales bacterium]
MSRLLLSASDESDGSSTTHLLVEAHAPGSYPLTVTATGGQPAHRQHQLEHDMNAALLTIARWAHRRSPQLAMCIATVAGLGVGLIVAYALPPTNDLVMNLTVGACMVAFQSVVYGVLVRSNRAVVPPPILVWVVGLTVVITLALIL